jgi:hypothetical protein
MPSAKFGDWSQLADGCYLLLSNLTGVYAATWMKNAGLGEAPRRLLEELAKL